MKKNKILILFLIFIVISFTTLWNIVQSKYVGDQISKYLDETIQKEIDAEVYFDNLNIKLYPPGLELTNFNLSRKDLKISLKKVSFAFDMASSLQKEVTIDKVNFENGSVKIHNLPKDEKDSKINFDLEKILTTVNEKLPVGLNAIVVKDIALELNEKALSVESIKVMPKKKSLYLESTLKSIILEHNKIKKNVDVLSFKTELFNKKLKVYNLQVEGGVSFFELKGEIDNYLNEERLNLDLSYSSYTNLSEINNIFNLNDVFKMEKGKVYLKGRVNGGLKDFLSTNTLKVKEFITPFVDGDLLTLDMNVNSKGIYLKKIRLSKDDQRMFVDREIDLFNFNTKSFIDKPIFAKFEKFQLQNGLKFLKPLSVLRGDLTGNIEFNLNKNDFHFLVKDEVEVSPLQLVIGKNRILNIPFVKLEETSFSVYGKKFEMTGLASIEDTQLKIKGNVANGNVKFIVKDAKVSLEELGQIASFEMKGKGIASVEVIKNNKDAFIDISSELDDFSFESIKQNGARVDLRIDLNKNLINFRNVDSSIGQSQTKAKGYLNLADKSMNFVVDHPNIIYSDIVEALGIKEGFKEQIQGSWKANYKLKGGFSLKDINLVGKVYSKNSILLQEPIDSISSKVLIKNGSINLENLLLKKNKSSLSGSVIYKLEEKKIVSKLDIKELLLQELNIVSQLPLGINGKLNGSLEGEYVEGSPKLKGKFHVTETKIPGKKLGDSNIKIDLNKRDLNLDVSLIGDKIKLKSNSHFEDKRKSKLDFNFKVDDINEIIGTNRLVDLDESNIEGELYAKGGFIYDSNTFEVYEGLLNINKFKFKKDIIDLVYENPEISEIKIKNKKVENWKVYVRGRNAYFISQARGAFDKKISMETDFKVDASIFEVLNKIISKGNGAIYGKYKVNDIKEVESQKLQLKADGISLGLKSYPIRLEDIDFLLSADTQNIIINKFRSKLGAGEVKLSGGVNLEGLFPNIDLDFKFINAGINLFEKSSLIFSGQGKVEGDNFPYLVKSNVYINRFNLINEFSELIPDDSSFNSNIKYLPNSSLYSKKSLVDLDINIKTTNSASIKNSMADINLLADLKITGSENNIKGKGEVFLAPGINKVYFKGNEFNIDKLIVNFLPNRVISNPELSVEASSTIEKYRLSAKVLGPTKNFDLNLTSDPYLEKSDILSLIAFGYTENTSSALSQEQRSLMTQAGIGALIFERFKINETLKNELGIQLNLGTEISTDNESYLSQRSGTGANAQRVNSATKIEIKKEITSNVDLSVSSTIGSGIGQRQRMNLNYNISNQLSLEGIYENRTDSQGINQRQDTSVGVDVNMKWSFK